MVLFGLSPVLCSEVCPGKASMFSRRQSCRGRSQSPVVRIAEEMETEPSKPGALSVRDGGDHRSKKIAPIGMPKAGHWFVPDSPLEGGGFELPVRERCKRCLRRKSPASAACRRRSSAAAVGSHQLRRQAKSRNRTLIAHGTGSSNPPSSSGESTNFRFREMAPVAVAKSKAAGSRIPILGRPAGILPLTVWPVMSVA